jgi:sensor histidine kinase YesM
MRELGNRLIGDENSFSFEQRIFNFVLLLSICMTVFGTLLDIHYGIGIWVDLMFVGCWILTYYFSRVHAHFDIVSKISIGIFIFAFFPCYWMSSGGISGTIPCFAVLFIAILCIISKGNFRIAMTISMLAVTVLLVCGDFHLNGSTKNIMDLIFAGVQILFIMGAMAILTVFYSGIHMKEKARSEAYARTIEEHYRQQLYYMKNLEEMTDRLKSERHDFNHHLGVIYGLLESGDANKAGEYASQLVKTAGNYQKLVNVPYPMVRAMLNYKLSAAKEKNIRLKLHVGIPEGLALQEFDLTVILGNLLDNAVEACMTVDENDRTIGFNMFYKPDYLIIQTENPVNDASKPQNGSHRTTKSDAENHGYGLRNIEFLAQKHNGFMKTARENGVFKVDVALLTEPGQSSGNPPSSL